MKIKVESEKIVKAVKELEGIEMVLENAEDAKEAINLILKRTDLLKLGDLSKLKDVKVSSFQEYKTSAVDYTMVFLLEFVFVSDASAESRVAVIKALQEFFRGHELTASEWDETRSKMFPRIDRYQKEAYWALMKIARQHGGAFLCDGVGLGKTHLLQAIGHYARTHYPHLKVKYVDTQQLVDEFTRTVRHDPSGMEAFKDELSHYKTGKGSVQFPLDQPLPTDLIRRIVEFRVEENLRKTAR